MDKDKYQPVEKPILRTNKSFKTSKNLKIDLSQFDKERIKKVSRFAPNQNGTSEKVSFKSIFNGNSIKDLINSNINISLKSSIYNSTINRNLARRQISKTIKPSEELISKELYLARKQALKFIEKSKYEDNPFDSKIIK